MKAGQVLTYLIIFLALGLFYYAYEVKFKTEPEKTGEAGQEIYDSDFAEVAGLDIKTRNGGFKLIKDTPDSWRMLEPMNTPADKWLIELVIRRLLTGQMERVFQEPVENIEGFGLTEPSLSITMMAKPKEGRPAEALAPALHIGDETPTGQLYYARLGNSKKVFLVSAAFFREVDRNLYEYRDKSLVLVPGPDIEELRITKEDGRVIGLKKSGLRKWSFTEPEPGPADGDRLYQFVYQGLKGRTAKFVDPAESDGDRGFESPRLKIDVLDQGKTVEELIIGAEDQTPAEPALPVPGSPPAGQRYWARSSARKQLMLVSADILKVLDVNYDLLKDRHILRLDWPGLTVLTLNSGPEKLKAVRQDGEWRLEPPDDSEQAPDIDALVLALSDLRFAQELDADPKTVEKFKLDDPDLVVDLETAGGEVESLSISYEEPHPGIMAVRVGSGPVYLVDRRPLAKTIPEAFRQPDEPAAVEK